MNDISKAKTTNPDATMPVPGLVLHKVPNPPNPLAQSRVKLVRSSEADLGNLWAAILPTGTPFESVLVPSLWSNHAMRMHVGDQVEVHADDQSFFGRVLVRQLGGTGAGKLYTQATVAVLEHYEFDRVALDENAEKYKIEHRGAHLKFCVVTTLDSKIVSDGHTTKEAADMSMRGLLRAA